MYNPKDSQIYLIDDKEITQKYISQDKITGYYHPNLLGYPTSDSKDASQSFAKTEGKYQDFVNGQVYLKDNLWPWSNQTTIVFGKIAEYYNSNQNMRNGMVGSGGVLGWPIWDSYQPAGNNELLQKFEYRMLKLANNNFTLIGHDDHERRMENKEYAKKVLKDVIDGKITDVEAFANVADYVAYVVDGNDMFVKDLTKLLTGVESVFYERKVITKMKNENQNEYQLGNNYDTGEVFSDTGFRFEYNDSHYCMDEDRNELKANPYVCVSNQPFHAIAGFSLAYLYSIIPSMLASYYHERQDAQINALGYAGSSKEDLNLGMIMASSGERLRLNSISRQDIGQWILDNIADKNYLIQGAKREDVIELANHIKKFRIYEYEVNGNTNGRWQASSNVVKTDCGGSKTIYYQNYNYFYNDSQNMGESRAVWDHGNSKMVLLYGSNFNKYSDMSKLCSDIDYLSNNIGYSLHLKFNKAQDDPVGSLYLLDFLKQKISKPNF